MSTRNSLIHGFANKQFRDSVVVANIREGIAFQVRTTRKARSLKQADLAKQAGMKQQVISRLESASDSQPSIRTLVRLASALDVALVVKFVPFGQLADELSSLDHEAFAVPSFEEEQLRVRQAAVIRAQEENAADDQFGKVVAFRMPEGLAFLRGAEQ